MWPRLTIEALALAEGCENLNRPDMKSWSRMSVVLAISPPTLTWAPAPNITPLGLMIRIWPLADRLPLMKEVLFERTRFSVKDCALGWAKVSDWPEASEVLPGDDGLLARLLDQRALRGLRHDG